MTGGNEQDLHLLNVNPGRDFTVTRYADIRMAQSGDACPRCESALQISRGIEVGHIFKLGIKYSKTMDATYLDQQGREQYLVMGCYGIGVGRTVAAAIEQSHDENGIIFPPAIAPFSVVVVPVNTRDGEQMAIAEKIYAGLAQIGASRCCLMTGTSGRASSSRTRTLSAYRCALPWEQKRSKNSAWI